MTTSEQAARIAFLHDVMEHGYDHAVMRPTEIAYRAAIEQRVRREEAWKAHRPVSGVEADPQNGRFHGMCIRCIRDWPCEYSPEYSPEYGENRDKLHILALMRERDEAREAVASLEVAVEKVSEANAEYANAHEDIEVARLDKAREVDALLAAKDAEIAELKRVPDGGAMDRAVAAEAKVTKLLTVIEASEERIAELEQRYEAERDAHREMSAVAAERDALATALTAFGKPDRSNNRWHELGCPGVGGRTDYWCLPRCVAAREALTRMGETEDNDADAG